VAQTSVCDFLLRSQMPLRQNQNHHRLKSVRLKLHARGVRT